MVWEIHNLTGKLEKPKDLLTLQYLNREKAKEEIRGLREVAIKQEISIVLGHDLTTQGKLRNREFLHHHDTEIHVRFIKKYGVYRLEVAPGSPYVETNSWDLILDKKTSRFLPACELSSLRRPSSHLSCLPEERWRQRRAPRRPF